MINIDDKLKKEIGNRLIRLRKNKGKTLNNVIEIMNTNYNIDLNERSLRRYESGESIPKIDNLICLADYYGVSLDYLIYGKETSDDNLLNWEQSFKRINRLFLSMIIIPYKSNEIKSNYKKYYFLTRDSEISSHFDNLISYLNSSHQIERNEPFGVSLLTMDNLINESYKNDSNNLMVSFDRMEKYESELGKNIYTNLQEQIEENEKERKLLRKNL